MLAEVALLERLWLDLWNERAIDQMMDLVHPDYAQCDHRPLQMSGSSLDDLREVTEAWWQLVPGVRCTALSVIAAAPQLVAYTLRFEGNDSVSGGRVEMVASVVTRFEDGRTREAHFFEEPEEAAAYFATHS